jgi:hypothetical protein
VLASQQAIVRRAYERSIEELSASSSLADQVIARSLEKFVATMPSPEANSARATRIRDVSADPHERPLAPSRSGSDVDTLDPLSAALARSRDMREGIRSKDAPASTDDLNPVERQSLTGPDLERLRALLDQANQPHDQGPANRQRKRSGGCRSVTENSVSVTAHAIGMGQNDDRRSIACRLGGHSGFLTLMQGQLDGLAKSNARIEQCTPKSSIGSHASMPVRRV